MNKHTIIVIISVLAILASFVYSLMNIYALDNLQIRGENEKSFTFFDMINDGNVEICNSMPFFINYNKLSIIVYFDDDKKGIYSTKPGALSPYSSSIINGTFTSETFSEMQYLALHYDAIFSDSAPERIDPRRLTLVTTIEAPIIGIIPHTIIKQYSGLYFWETLNEKIGEYNC